MFFPSLSPGDYPACTSFTRHVWISGWPPAGSVPSAEWTLRPSWPRRVDSSCPLLRLQIRSSILHRLPPGGGALPNTLPSSCITQRACLLRQLLQRDQQSTLTYNTKRDDRGRGGGWCTDTGRSAEWTLLDANGRKCMDRCAEASHDSVRLCTPVHISPYSHKESTNLLAQCGVLGPLFSAKPPPPPSALRPVKNPLSCALPKPSLSTSVQNIIKWLAWGCVVWTLVAERLWCHGTD